MTIQQFLGNVVAVICAILITIVIVAHKKVK